MAVTAVNMAHHLAQRLQIQAGRLGQLHGFARRGVGGERQHVAGQLHSGSGSRAAGADDHRRPQLERRLDLFVDVTLGTHHGGELALLGSRGAATDRCVGNVNALRLQLLGKFDGCRVTDRRVDRDDGARFCVGGQLADDLPHLGIVENGHADDVRGRDVGHAVHQRRTRFASSVIASVLMS